MIYLDYAANSPAEAAVITKFCEMEASFPGNPNSSHPAGLEARRELDMVTAAISDMLGAEPSEVIYTSGATESNNLAIKGIAEAGVPIGRHIISTPLEHSSVRTALEYLSCRGWEVDMLDIRPDGSVELEQLKSLLRKDTVLLALCAVDSELGAIQPLEEIKAILKAFPDCRLHVDATQAIGKIPVSFSGVDTMSISPHKFGGINGSGLLLKSRRTLIAPLIHGGSGSSALRGGTPALSLAASSETALRLALEHMPERNKIVSGLHSQLIEALTAYGCVRINSPANSIPHIINLSVNGIKGTRFQRALSKRGVCVSVKSACSTGGEPSRAVFAVSGDRKNALSSWRISLSHRTVSPEINRFMELFDDCLRELAPVGN
ncbi:MAG: cysteine desulfurase family protein [Oscillospiraceae bacterium]